VLPSYETGLFPGQPGIASGTLFEICTESKLPGPVPGDRAELFIPNRLEFPANLVTTVTKSRSGRQVEKHFSRNAASFDIDGSRVEIYNGERHAVISCDLPSGAIRANRHLRIRESIEFALGQSTVPCALNSMSGDTETVLLRSYVFSQSPEARQRPPLRFQPGLPNTDVFSIVRPYYEKLKDNDTERGPNVSIGINAVIRAASASLETQALVIPVSAETLVKACFPDIVKIDPRFVAEVETFKMGLDREKLSPELYNKLSSSLAYYIDPTRQAGQIKAFVESSGIPKEIFDSWSDLRNKHAHGEPVSEKNAEQVIKKIQETLYLCYSVVLKFIGYSGPRTNYAVLGFPTEEFRP